MGTGMGARTGSGRVEDSRRSARNRTRVVDAMWETGEIWVERGKTVPGRQERVGSVAANPDNLDNDKETGGGAHDTKGLSKNVQAEIVCLLCRV